MLNSATLSSSPLSSDSTPFTSKEPVRLSADAIVKVTSPSFSKNPLLREELLHSYPNACFNDEGKRLEGDALIEWLSDADAAVIGLEPLTGEVIEALPRLRMVAKFGVGLDNIDQETCIRRGIAIGWSGGVNRRSVSEQTLCLMIGLCRNLYFASRQLHAGVWNKSGGYELTGKTVGIIGLGFIGRDLVKLLAPFRCRILVNDVLPIDDFYAEHGLIAASKEEIYRSCHVVTLHLPMSPETRNMINAETLKLFRKDAFLINTARGGLVDQDALKSALREHQLAGAAMDVYSDEPVTDPELLALPNLVCTPHIGGSAVEAVMAMGRSAIGHLVDRRISASPR